MADWALFADWARFYDSDWDPETDPPARIFCAWHCMTPRPGTRVNLDSAASCLANADHGPKYDKWRTWVEGKSFASAVELECAIERAR